MRRIELLDGIGQVAGLVDIEDGEVPDAHVPYYTGAVAWREVDPALVAAERSAREAEERLQNALLKGAVLVLFNHENRLRALEAKAPVSLEQFKQALKAILGL